MPHALSLAPMTAAARLPEGVAGAPAAAEATRGLVLTGGGARAAYQVGVLLGIRRILVDSGWPADVPQKTRNGFSPAGQLLSTRIRRMPSSTPTW